MTASIDPSNVVCTQNIRKSNTALFRRSDFVDGLTGISGGERAANFDFKIISIILFLIGTLVTILGALFKITHMEIGPITGNVLLTIGMLSQVLSGIFFIVKLFFNTIFKNCLKQK